MTTHIQLNLLENTFAVKRPRRPRKTTSQLSMFTGRETLGRLLLAGRPCGPIGGPFSLRVQGRPSQPTLPSDEDAQAAIRTHLQQARGGITLQQISERSGLPPEQLRAEVARLQDEGLEFAGLMTDPNQRSDHR